MKLNKIYSLILAGTMLGAGFSCTDGYESEPVETYTIDFLFSVTDSAGTRATRFLADMYETLLSNGHNRVGSDYLDAASGDAISINDDDPDVYKLATGLYSAQSVVSSDMKWSVYWTYIRQANIFLANIDRVPLQQTYTNALGETHSVVESMKTEARFLRAYAYFEMIKRYGGVPLIGDRVFELGDDMEIPRNTFEECVTYIVNELDAIRDNMRVFPSEASWMHAPTAEANMALKTRVLLYAASPLFNESPIETGNELVGYKEYDPTRWELAAKAAKELIDTYGHLGSGVCNLTSSWSKLFSDYYNSSNPEVIWFVQGGTNYSIETNNGPLGFSGGLLGYGRTLPTQNLVDAFPMLDGKAITDNTGAYTYTDNNPYANRDPRLELTVLHHGSIWLNNSLELNIGGAHNPVSSAEYCKTGYYLRKFMKDHSTSSATTYESSIHLWVELRYAEVLLNYAEAMNEAYGPSQDIYDVLCMIRQRAGIEAGENGLFGYKENMNKDEMREAIRAERRIEMAFEEQRYWDIRRWKIAEDVFATPLKGMRIVTTQGVDSYSRIDVLTGRFDERQYLYPLPYSEILKNHNMVQNPNW